MVIEPPHNGHASPISSRPPVLSKRHFANWHTHVRTYSKSQRDQFRVRNEIDYCMPLGILLHQNCAKAKK